MIIKTCNKYLLRSFNSIFLVVSLVLISMVWLINSLKLIDLITNKGLGFFNFLKISAMLITPLSYTLIPISLLISSILIISRLSHDRELVILRGAGLSNFQIAKPIIFYALVIMFINYAISMYLLPKSYREFKHMQDIFKNKYLSLFLEEGVFNTQINDLTVYINSKESDSKFKGIFIYDQRNHDKPITLMADSGTIRRTNIGPEFVLYNGSHQEQDKLRNNVNLITFDKYRFSLALFTDDSFLRSYSENEMYVHELLNFDTEDKAESKYFVYGNQRIIWPLYSVSLVIISVGAMLLGSYRRRSSISRNMTAGIVSTIIIILSLFFHNLALKNVIYVIFMYLNLVLSFVIGFILITEHRYANFLKKIELFIQSINLKKS